LDQPSYYSNLLVDVRVHEYVYVVQQHTTQHYAQRESVLSWHRQRQVTVILHTHYINTLR